MANKVDATEVAELEALIEKIVREHGLRPEEFIVARVEVSEEELKDAIEGRMLLHDNVYIVFGVEDK